MAFSVENSLSISNNITNIVEVSISNSHDSDMLFNQTTGTLTKNGSGMLNANK